MNLLSLPIELLYNICFQLSLNDIQNLFVSNKFFFINIKINWKDYFIYHTGIDETMLNLFNINKDFMIEHGRFLINKSIQIIKQYSLLYPQLIALNLTGDKIACYKINVIHFLLDDINNYIIIYFGKTRHYKQLHIWKDKILIDKTAEFLLFDIYDQIKDVLLTQNIGNIRLIGEEEINIQMNGLNNH
jgi:hypothetical protein